MMEGGQPKLKKSLERSFDDLLKGLEDESLPDLDEMITDEQVEELSILTPNQSQLNESVHVDTTLPEPVFSLRVDFNGDEKKQIEDLNNHSDLSSEDDTSDEEFLTNENPLNEPDAEMGYQVELMENRLESRTEDVDMEFTENEVMEEGNANYSAFDHSDVAETEDLDFSVSEDADQLNLDHSKHKKSLGRRGSLANRRKPSRSGMRSSSTDSTAMFQDSTEPHFTKTSQDEDFTSDEESPSPPTSAPPKKIHAGIGIELPCLQQDQISCKLKSPPPNIRDRKGEDSSLKIQVNLKPVVKNTQKSEVEKENVSHTYAKPSLRNVDRNVSKVIDLNKEHVFNKPILRSVDKKWSEKEPTSNKEPIFMTHLRDTSELNTDGQQSLDPAVTSSCNMPALRKRDFQEQVQDQTFINGKTVGIFEKPELRRIEIHHIKDTAISNAGMQTESQFEKPALRNVSQVSTSNKMSNKTETEKPLWLTDMKLKKVCDNSNDKTPQSKETKQPSWLHSTTEKKKLAVSMKTKENQADDYETTDKNMSALSSESAFSNPRSLPLSENGENVRNIQFSDTSSRKLLDFTDGQNSLIANDSGQLKHDSKGSKNNYTPSWLKSKDNLKAQHTTTFLRASSISDTPQWKLELANRNKAKKTDPQDNGMLTDDPNLDSNIPPWKRELSQRKKRPVVQQASFVASSEPEWKKMADERRTRLTRIGQPDHHAPK